MLCLMPSFLQAIKNKQLHSISFTLSRSQAIIVEFQRDQETDLFQVSVYYTEYYKHIHVSFQFI